MANGKSSITSCSEVVLIVGHGRNLGFIFFYFSSRNVPGTADVFANDWITLIITSAGMSFDLYERSSGHNIGHSGFSRISEPPAYGSWNMGPETATAGPTTAGYSAWDPRGWSLIKKLAVAAGVVVVIVAVVVGAVLGVRATRYPSYTKLDYSLVDTYSGSDFFDNFYYATSDPSGGFVQYVSNEVAPR